jgi:hypothetical protein
MVVPGPKLDDRTFQSLVDEAKKRIADTCPLWTDHNVSDPGIALVEIFAWMTEMLIYRINQVPEKNYIALLNLLGIQREPPRPARGEVIFEFHKQDKLIAIPRGTEVTTEDRSIVFTTDRDEHLPVGDTTVTIPVTQGRYIPLEELTFEEGLRFHLKNRPIVAPSAAEVVEVEIAGKWEACAPLLGDRFTLASPAGSAGDPVRDPSKLYALDPVEG